MPQQSRPPPPPGPEDLMIVNAEGHVTPNFECHAYRALYSVRMWLKACDILYEYTGGAHLDFHNGTENLRAFQIVYLMDSLFLN